ncbi:MAG: hypothetical protein JO242_28640 [Streptosporangiaceae bacterium]|nr:hypothetical protein [Streptosporangiaceae bacterium]
MPEYPSLSPQVIGQAEKTLNAFLDRLLAGTGLTEPLWVTLALTAATGPIDHDELVGRVAGAVAVTRAEAQARVAALAAAGLLQVADGEGALVKLTDAGHQTHGQVRARVAEITKRLWGDLPAEDLATAGHVLSIVAERGRAELARA